jgi:hypothetical protein
MRDFSSIASFFAIAAGISMLFGAAIIDTNPPTKSTIGYRECIQIHPERYCGITYLGKQ